MPTASHSTIGSLYIVATPIGNLDDWSTRAVNTLKNVDLIACEDTRHSLPLLKHYGIGVPCRAYHAHNENEQSDKLIRALLAGQSVALISDAGTPLISDPGAQLIRQAQTKNIPVIPIPGACAAITALCASGLATHEFRFIGFLPSKGEKRSRQLQQLCEDPATVILYESVHRIADLMTLLHETLEADREVCIARELTKRFEQIKTAPIDELQTWFFANPDCHKGEFVVLISGAKPKDADEAKIIDTLNLLLDHLPLKKAAVIAAKLTGERKNTVYEIALKLKESR